jgi:hypothetical protein
MLMSGNPDGSPLDKGWVFLKKPVLPLEVIKKIEGILERPPPAEQASRSPGAW